MLYATGDTHGDWTRLRRDNFPEQSKMTKADYVVILGDFGIWDGSRKENMMMDWLNNLPFTTLFVDGNHENYDILDQYKDVSWNGGNVHKIRPSVIHLQRGQIFELDGNKIFTFGGASSHDIQDGILDRNDQDYASIKARLDRHHGMYRINHQSWWERELPSQEELDNGIVNLEKNNWKVDYIFTHSCPTGIQSALKKSQSAYQPDILTDYFDMLREKCDYKVWLFGHMHQNKKAADKLFCLYEQILRIY